MQGALHSLFAQWHELFLAAAVPEPFASDYAQSFTENEIELDQAPELTTEILKELKVKLGHILRILRHVKELRQ